MKSFKKFSKEAIIWLMVFTTVCWSASIPFTNLIEKAQAAGGIEIMSVFEGNNSNINLGNANTPEAFSRIAAYETSSGTHTLDSITLYIMPDMDCMGGPCTESPFLMTDLSSLSIASTSGLSLWRDDGDDTFEFANGQDTLISSTTPTIPTLTTANVNAKGQITITGTDPMGGTFNMYVWQVTFSNLNLAIPSTYGSLDIFVAAKAEAASIDESPLNKFMPVIPVNGVNITTTNQSATITDFPTNNSWWMPSVTLSASGGGNQMYNAPVVISEVQTAGGTATDEFIELYNKTASAVDLSTWSIQYRYSYGTTTVDKVDLTGSIPANGFYLITNSDGYDGGVAANKAQTAISLSSTGGSIVLANNQTALTPDTIASSTTAVDKLAYGSGTFLHAEGTPAPAPPANGSLERKAFYNSTPSTMKASGIHNTKGNTEDSMNNSADFVVRLAADGSNPQNASSATETPTISAATRDIIINEVLYNVTSGKWIELYNASSTPIDISGWKILAAATSTAQTYIIPANHGATCGGPLAANSYLLVYWDRSGTDSATSTFANMGVNLSSYGGDITLTNGANYIYDYIQYGGSGKAGETAAATAGKWPTGDSIPNSNYNESIARRGTTGDDYNNSGDWMYMSTPTPGYPNTGGDTTSPTAVTGVTLTDPDTGAGAIYGVDGNDVRVVWTPSATVDSSFDRYEIYILPEGTSLDTAAHTTFTRLYGQYMYSSGTKQSTYTFTGFNDANMKKDGVGTALATASYRAYVVAVDFAGNRSAAVASPVAVLTSDAGGDDTNPPMIDHMPVWRAEVDQNLTFYARMGDDRALSTTELAYKIDSGAWGTSTSTCAAPAMAGASGLYACSIAFGAWNANTTLSYYLIAKDTSNNYKYLGMFPTDSEATAKANPITVDFVAAWDDAGATADLTGTVLNNADTPLQDAFAIIDGVATAAATTTAAGTFSFADNILPEGLQYVRVIKAGYMEQSREITRDQSGINFRLGTGFMNNAAGGSGGTNGVKWTAPMDGMMGAPVNIACTGSNDCSTMGMGDMPIVISFFNQMNATTIDDTDALNSGSNIYLTADGNTKIAGKVKYVYSAGSGMSEARFYSSTALSYNTFYTVVITPNVKDVNGNPISSNRPNGNYEFSFNTMADNSTMWQGGNYSGFGTGGMMMPPYVMGTNPTPGSFNIPLGAVLTVEFSEPMDSTSISTNVKLYKITSTSPWTGTEVTDKNVSVSLDSATKKVATISHTALDANAANNGWYEIRVMAAAKSQLGSWLGNPSSCSTAPEVCLATQTHYTSSFQVGSSNDTTAPTVKGTYPSNNDGISNTNYVDVAVSSLEISFSEAMNPSTINNQNITLTKGSVSVAGTVKFDAMSNSAKFTPTSALSSNNVYTLTVVGTGSSGVADLSGNYLASNSIISFKTGSADTTRPQVLYANADDYQIALTFSEPMNSALQTDTDNWTYSVLNPANYFVNSETAEAACATPGSWACTPTLISPYNTVGGDQVSGLTSITISYDGPTQTVTLKGFAFASANEFQIFVDAVKDRSGNTILDTTNRSGSPTHRNAVRGTLQDSSTTYGMLGPGGGAGMMMGGGGPGGGAGMMVGGGGPTMDMGKMGMFMAAAMPMNAMAGQTSMYFVDIPLTKKLQDGMFVTLTFPTGFDVSAVAKDPYSPMNNDMNDRGAGVITFDASNGVGGVASTTKNVTTIKLDIVSGTVNATAGPDGFIDFLHMDLKGIKNSSVPKDFGTTGYTVDIKTKSADGAVLENISTMPFFITEGGTNTLTVVITAPNAGTIASTTSVFLGSPMTGPMEGVSTAFVSNVATSTFTNIPTGSFMLFTDPFITIGATNYLGKPMPEPIQITSSATTKTITLEKDAAGAGKAAVTVYLTGDYSTGGVADDVDIFTNSAAGFRVKTLTDVGATAPNTTLYLTEGEWMMGVGIAMPKGPMSGPPPMPDWMSPPMVRIVVGIQAATARDLNPGGAGNAAPDPGGNANPVKLNMADTSNLQVGDAVTFATGAAAATTTITSLVVNTSITVTPQGNWTTLPLANDTVTSVRETSNGANDKKVFFDVSTQSLKQIQGFVLDDAGLGVGNAEVYGYQPQGTFGSAHTTTDTAGKFTLKVGTIGAWTIGANKPGMPNAKGKSVDVKANVNGNDGNTTAEVYLDGTLISDVSSDNTGSNPLRLKLKKPSYTISGKVLNASSTPVSYAPVWAYQPTGWGHADTMTDSSGSYILYVDAGTWTVEADAPGVGWLQYDTTVTVSTASQSNINLKPATGTNFYAISGNVSVDGAVQTYMPIRAVLYDANGNYQGREFNASTDASGNYTLTVPGGSTKYYRVDTWTQNYGEVELAYDEVANSPANVHLTAATTTANILVAAADLKTISLQFTNGKSTQTGFLNIEGVTSDSPPKPTGFHLSKNINDLSATSTVKLKAGRYFFFLDVPGLGSSIPDLASRQASGGDGTNIIVAGDRAVYFTLTDIAGAGVITISGTVKDGSSTALANAWAWVGNPNSYFQTGVETGNNGTFSLTVPKLNSGSYNLGADKPGYMSSAPATIAGTANSASNTVTLNAAAQNIVGYVKNASAVVIPNAWVWAKEATTGAMAHAPADATGYYSLPVTNGTWSVMAGADGYTEDNYRVNNTKTNITVSGSTQTPAGQINIVLTANSNWSMKTKSSPVTPSSGGTVDDTGSSGVGVKVIIPPNALGSGQSSGNFSMQETSAVTKTNSAAPFGNKGKTITATDNSGTAITNLNDYIDVEIVYYKADEAITGMRDYSKLKTLTLGYWDSTLNNWVNLSTTKSAYYKLTSAAAEWSLMPASATQSGYDEFADSLVTNGISYYYDFKLVFTAKTNHLTVFGAFNPPDGLLPASPTGLAQTSGSGTSVVLSWTAVTKNTDNTDIADLLGYEVYRSTDGTTYTQINAADVATTAYTDSTTSAWTSYYYKITAADDGGNETTLANSTALQMCSNKTVSNGTVAAICAITCNSGYTVSGNSCVSNPGGGVATAPTTCTSVTYGEWQACINGWKYRNVLSQNPSGCALSTEQDNARKASCSATVEKIVEETKETTKEVIETTKQAAQAFADKLVTIATEAAEVIKANINSLLGKFGFKRDLAKEQVSVKKHVKDLIKDIPNYGQEKQNALNNFIAYGTDTTKKLGEGERAGVVNSYKSAFGKLPATEAEWSDAIKIANGRWPSETNKQSETNATEAFKKIYLRNPDRTNPNDDAAVTVIAYGLRPADRNLNSEKAAIKIFKAIYGYNPKTATAWDIVRAIAYSGAKR